MNEINLATKKDKIVMDVLGHLNITKYFNQSKARAATAEFLTFIKKDDAIVQINLIDTPSGDIGCLVRVTYSKYCTHYTVYKEDNYERFK